MEMTVYRMLVHYEHMVIESYSSYVQPDLARLNYTERQMAIKSF